MMNESKTATLRIRLTPSDRSAIEKLAREHDRPVAAEVRRAIRRYVVYEQSARAEA